MSGPSIVRQPVQGTASSTGAVTLTFPSVQGVSPGASVRATVAVVDSAPGTNWSVLVNGDTRGTMLGASGFGPFDVASADKVQLTTTNANPGQMVHGWMTGYAQLNLPPGTTPAQVNAVSNVVPIVPLASTNLVGGGSLDVPSQPYYRELLIMAKLTVASAITITGDTTGVTYASASPLATGSTFSAFQCGFGSAWETGFTLTFTGGTGTVFVAADQSYDQEFILGTQTNKLVRHDGRFYPEGDGAASGSVNGSGTLIATPGVGNHLLLLSLTVVGNSKPAADTAISVTGTIGGSGITLSAGVSYAVGSATAVSTVWPSGLLLDANTAVTFSTAGGAGTFSLTAIFDTVT